MNKYHHLSYAEREKIALLKNEGKSTREVAKILVRGISTIYNELRRNQAPPGCYWPDRAQIQYDRRRHRRGCVIDQVPELKNFIESKLRCNFWTPEQISGWLKHRQVELLYVCHEAIYQWIYRKPQKNEKLWKFLPRYKAKRGLRKSKGKGEVRIIPNRTSIHERPKEVEGLQEFGHWEGDLMSYQKNSQHMLVLRERQTMQTLSVPLPNKKAISTKDHIINLLGNIPFRARKTLTLDNGGEFARHTDVTTTLGIETYFCDPYKSWQKGGVENTNGRLRRDLPRKTNLKEMSQEDFDEILDNYNSTPRKRLGWLTPSEAFQQNLQSVSLQH